MTGFPRAVRRQVLQRANGRCERCGLATVRFELHHRRPRGMGGSKAIDTNTAANALALCGWCHRWIEVNRNSAIKGGWLVLQSQRPDQTEVLRAGKWSLLHNDGSFKTRGES